MCGLGSPPFKPFIYTALTSVVFPRPVLLFSRLCLSPATNSTLPHYIINHPHAGSCTTSW